MDRQGRASCAPMLGVGSPDMDRKGQDQWPLRPIFGDPAPSVGAHDIYLWRSTSSFKAHESADPARQKAEF